MGKHYNLIGQRFGLLTVTKLYGKDKFGKFIWECQCDCGNITRVKTSSLVNRYTRSCGCLQHNPGILPREERIIHDPKHGRYRHGYTGTRIYGIYQGMCSRCYRTSGHRYPEYGGRGIYICDEWYTPNDPNNTGLLNFIKWSYANGYYDQIGIIPRSQILSIDRIDNDGPYAPWNCRWITMAEQAANTRCNMHIDVHGDTISYADFSKKFNVHGSFVHKREMHGWPHSVIVYAAEHPELNLRKVKNRNEYRDSEGFLHIIRK